MAVTARLRGFLDEHRVPYHVLRHHRAYTAREIAEALHVPGKELAKVVIINADDKMVMGALSSNFSVDLQRFAQVAGAQTARIATEGEFGNLFPDCEMGAMPPFGNLYDMPVFVDRSLAEDDVIVFEAGNHHEAIRIKYAEFERLVKPTVADFSVR
ncbi:MAG: aminoacyl-tRNA deacylase [Planctomycetota bacterium]|jgi:Ala-tRNA(Pro) deacylase